MKLVIKKNAEQSKVNLGNDIFILYLLPWNLASPCLTRRPRVVRLAKYRSVRMAGTKHWAIPSGLQSTSQKYGSVRVHSVQALPSMQAEWNPYPEVADRGNRSPGLGLRQMTNNKCKTSKLLFKTSWGSKTISRSSEVSIKVSRINIYIYQYIDIESQGSQWIAATITISYFHHLPSLPLSFFTFYILTSQNEARSCDVWVQVTTKNRRMIQ